MRIPTGVTDRYIYFVALDSTDFVTRETGQSSYTVYYSFNGGAATLMSLPTINETDLTNMPGVYELLIDESGMVTLAAGDDTSELVLHITHSGMAPVTRTIEIYRPETTEGETHTVASGVGTANTTLIEGVDATDAIETACDASLASYDGPTYTEMEARTLAAADYFLFGSDTVANVGTVATLTGHTAQTGDSFARLAAPAGVSVSADIAAVKADVAGLAGSAMRGTDSAFLATVGGAIDDAAAAGDPTAVDTMVAYVKQLINVLVGTTGVTTFPAEAAPANNVSLAEVIRAIHVDVTGLNGDAMRGTNSASTLTAADVNAEVVDVMAVDTIAQPSQAAPPSTGVATMQDALRYLYFAQISRIDSDAVANFLEFYDVAGTTMLYRKAMTDAASIGSEASAVVGV